MTAPDYTPTQWAPSRRLKILVCPANEGGCAFYRAINPYNKLQELYPHLVEVRMDLNPLGIDLSKQPFELIKDWEFENMHWADIIVTQNISNFGGQYTARIVGKGKEFGKLVHYDTDDLLTNLYAGHRLEDVYKEKGLGDITKFIYANSDIVTVTQRKFAERVAPFCANNTLAVVKNAIDYNLPCWNIPKIPPPRKNVCRIGWAAGIHHEEDVKEFASVPHLVNIKAGADNIAWGFYGRPPKDPKMTEEQYRNDWQQSVWRNYQRVLTRGMKGKKNFTIYPAMPSDRYGEMFANMDIAIAPLQMNEFNDSKSEIKVAEAGRYSMPLVASNVGCYDESIRNWETGVLIDPKAGKTPWVKALTRLVKDKKLREEMGQNLHQITEEYFDLNKVVYFRMELYNEVMKMKGIKLHDQNIDRVE